MSFHDCTFDLREAARGEAVRRKRELDALGKAVSRELTALHAKIDRLLAEQVRASSAAPRPPLRQLEFAKRINTSPSALWKMIKEDKVNTTPDRRIPESELRKFGL